VCDLETSRMGAPYIYIYIYIYDISRLRVKYLSAFPLICYLGWHLWQTSSTSVIDRTTREDFLSLADQILESIS